MFKIAGATMLAGLLLQSSGYRSDVQRFRAHRAEEIGGETGWAALTDLTWVAKGDHSIGRGAKNDVVLKAPSAPERLGTISVTDDAIALHVAAGVAATVNGKATAE